MVVAIRYCLVVVFRYMELYVCVLFISWSADMMQPDVFVRAFI